MRLSLANRRCTRLLVEFGDPTYSKVGPVANPVTTPRTKSTQSAARKEHRGSKQSMPSRKLAVILHADVVGSTTLVHLDETVAHERIRGRFLRFSETISGFGGTAHVLERLP